MLIVDLFKRLIVSVVTSCLVLTPTLSICTATSSAALIIQSAVFGMLFSRPALAQMTPEQAANLGETDGWSQGWQVQTPTSNPVTNTVTIHSTNPAVNNTTFSGDDLYQNSTSPDNAIEYSSSSVTYDDTAALNAQANIQATNLLSSPSPTGNAYQTLRNSAVVNNMSSTDLSADPTVATANVIAHGADADNFLGSSEPSCTTTTTDTITTNVVRVADPRSCYRYVGPPTCTITRKTVGSTTDPTIVLQVGGYTFNNNTISVRIFSSFANSGVLWAQTPAEIQAYFDTTNIQMTYTTSNPGQNPIYLSQGVGIITYGINQLNPNAVIKAYVDPTSNTSATITQVPSASNGFELIVSFGGPQTTLNYTDFKIGVTMSDVAQEETQDFPPQCSTTPSCSAQPTGWVSTGTGLDLASTNQWECTKTVPTKFGDAEQPPLFPGAPVGDAIPVCYKAVARDYKCSSPNVTPDNTCKFLDDNPTCKHIGNICEPTFMDKQTGTCYYQTERWDCGYDTVTSFPTSTTTTICTGPIRCIGSDCVGPRPDEVNSDFGQVAAGLSMANWAKFDQECDTGNCQIFKGEGYSCKVVFGGLQNCCDTPTGVSFVDYIKLAYYTNKMVDSKAVIAALDQAGMSGVTGAWTSLSNWTTATYNTVSQPIVSAWESLSNGVTNAVGLSPATAATTAPTMLGISQAKLSEWVASTFSNDIATGLFGSIGPGANFAETSIGQTMNYLGTVFMYYQVAMLVIQIVWACENREFELAVKKDMRLCHDLGSYCSADFLGICYKRSQSYCCYKSPLGRIIQEQAHLHSSIPWPPASANPVCAGLSLADFQAINWDQVDLSEWTALLQSGGLLGDGVTSSTMYSQDMITKYKNADGASGSSSLGRTQSALSGTNPSASLKVVRNDLWASLP